MPVWFDAPVSTPHPDGSPPRPGVDSPSPAGRRTPADLLDRSRGVATHVATFLRTEAGSSGALILAIVIAMLWANLGGSTYESFWTTPLDVSFGDAQISQEVREWVGNGLMTLFFLVVGLEARREFDLGSLRVRRAFLLPGVAGAVAMLVPVAIYLVVTAGSPASHGWAIAMSTDTALALGLLTLVGRGLPDRVRGFLLTLFIVDDLIALLVIAVAYTQQLRLAPLLVGVAAFVLFVVVRGRGAIGAAAGRVLAVLSWFAMLLSGVDPLVVGLAVGLSTRAYSPERTELDVATTRFQEFREQPTSRLAREATSSLRSTLSANERLQSTYTPWASYAIVPLFALANAGVHLDGPFLAAAVASPLVVGVVAAYLIGKPAAVLGVTALVTILSRGRIRPPVGWAAVAGAGTIAGVGFTVSVLVASRAFTGDLLEQAKFAVLVSIAGASLLTWALSAVVSALPERLRLRALLGRSREPVDLVPPVDDERDHGRGASRAVVTLVEYGDFQCPFCGMAEAEVRALAEHREVAVRFVWRHLPLTAVHPDAELAAEAAEAAGAQGMFWEMHDVLLRNQERLAQPDLIEHARGLGLDVRRFEDDLRTRRHRSHVEADLRSADASGVTGTPSFFVNGRRHYGAYDRDTLLAAVTAAHQAALAGSTQAPAGPGPAVEDRSDAG